MGETISSLWIGRALSPLEQLSIESFLQNGYEYHLYCYEKIAGIPRGAIICDAAEILPSSEVFHYETGPGKGSVAAFSNLFRYKLLLERGGWWMDTDMVCLRTLDFEEPVVIAGERADGKICPTNSAMKIPRGHSIAQKCFDEAHRQKDVRMKWGHAGPALVERVIEENKFQQFVQPPEVFCPWQFGDWEKMFLAQSMDDLILPQTRVIHLWHEAWRRHGLKLDPSGGLAKANPKFFRKIFPRQPRPCPPLAQLLEKYGLKK